MSRKLIIPDIYRDLFFPAISKNPDFLLRNPVRDLVSNGVKTLPARGPIRTSVSNGAGDSPR